jgi:hypothetical protein
MKLRMVKQQQRIRKVEQMDQEKLLISHEQKMKTATTTIFLELLHSASDKGYMHKQSFV